MLSTPPAATSLPALLDACAAAAPRADALVVGEARWSYAELAGRAGRAARALAALGVGEGDVVALLAPNIAEWIPVAFGAMRCGARVDAINTWVKAHDLDYVLGASTASVLVLADRVRNVDLLAELRSLVPELDQPGPLRSARFPALRHVVVIGNEVPGAASSWPELDAAHADDPPVTEPAGRSSAPAFVLYTSGSTSNPKAVPLGHRDLVVNGFHIGERMGLRAEDRVWFGSPLFWSFGCANALMATMTHQACLVLQEQFGPAAAAELMSREQVTAAYLLPTMVDGLVNQVAAQVRGITTLRTGVMIGRAEEVERAAVELGISEICNVYGSTETYGNCCVTDHRLPLSVRLTTQGTPLPGVELRVVDPDSGIPLPAGQPGELQVRGRLTPGYLNDDAANAAAFTPDGWYRTGDRLALKLDGSVSFVDRISDMIKTSGINVSPAEVEHFLIGHPDVAEALVVGAPHTTRSEVVVAFVVARPPATLTPETVRDYCRDRLAGYKVPWLVSIVPELPRTATGKVTRRPLKEMAAALVSAELAAASGKGPA